MTFCTGSIDLTSFRKNYQFRYYETEHIYDRCKVTVVVNPKDHVEQFRSENFNKKRKGLKKEQKAWTLKTLPRK